MVIKDIMTSRLITVNKADSVEECARIILEHELSGLPVLDGEKLVGIVTEGDLIRRASKLKGPQVLEVLGGLIYLEGPKKYFEEVKNTMGITAGEVMTKKLFTVKEDDSIEKAATLLEDNKVKRLPVLNEEGKLVGIVSRRDILSFLFPLVSD